MHKYKQLLSRLIFLGIFGLTVLGIFLISHSLSKLQGTASIGTVADDFIPIEKGKAILVEFSDFQCPACKAYYYLLKQLKNDFGDKLTVEYKYFPLRSIHKNADLSARAAESAKLQGKFGGMEEMLFVKQDEWKDSGQALSLFRDYAFFIGLDVERFNSNIDSNSVYDKVNSDYQEGMRLVISGTPTFFLNGKKLTNPRSYEEFSKLIQQSLEQ